MIAVLAIVALLALAACNKKTTTMNDEASASPFISPTPSSTLSPTVTPKTVHTLTKADVEQMQRELDAVGCFAGPVDGVIGPETIAGLDAFQKAAGLKVDGDYGPQTKTALSADFAAKKKVCGAKPTPTHSQQAHEPPCTNAAITAALKSKEFQGSHLAAYGCSGDYAYGILSGGQPTPAPSPSPFRYLLKAQGMTAWVIEACPSSRGSIPASVYHEACV